MFWVSSNTVISWHWMALMDMCGQFVGVTCPLLLAAISQPFSTTKARKSISAQRTDGMSRGACIYIYIYTYIHVYIHKYNYTIISIEK